MARNHAAEQLFDFFYGELKNLDNYDLECMICEYLVAYYEINGRKAQRNANILTFPELGITLAPSIGQRNNQSVLLRFEVSSEKWDKTVVENSAGMGSNQPESLSNAMESFTSAFLDGLLLMAEGGTCYERFDSYFAGHTHSWQVWLSDLVSIGEAPDIEEAQYYWEQLQDLIAERLGNQRFCVVKIFASRSFGSVTCECRIDGIISYELTEILEAMTRMWPTERFGSHKMFFFISQSPDTFIEGHNFSREYQKELDYLVNVVLRLYGQYCGPGEVEQLPDVINNLVEDHTLAEELCMLLPELCAQRKFAELSFSDAIALAIGRHDSPVLVFTHQMTDYMPICQALDKVLGKGTMPEDIKVAFDVCAQSSTIFKTITDILAKNPKAHLTDIKNLTLLLSASEAFVLR